MDVYFYIGLFIYPHLSLQIRFSLPMTATPVKTSRNQDESSAQLLIPFIYTLDIDFFSVDPFPLALKWTTSLPWQQMWAEVCLL